MANEYYTIITKAGQEKILSAAATGVKLNITAFALGDGSGSSYDPDETQTALRHEVYRAGVSALTITDDNILIVDIVVPAEQGGWVVREIGLYDADGDLIAIAKTPDEVKPSISSGLAKEVIYQMQLAIVNADTVSLEIDPTVAIATKDEVPTNLANGEGAGSLKTNTATNVASGIQAVAFGENIAALGDASQAMGRDTKASGSCAHATGHKTVASAEDATIVGRYGETASDDLFAVANGALGTPHLAFEVKADGSLYHNEQPMLADLTASIPITGWTASGSLVSVQVPLAGILATDNPVVDLNLSGQLTVDIEPYETAWAQIKAVQTDDGSLTVYASEAPSVVLPMMIKVVR